MLDLDRHTYIGVDVVRITISQMSASKLSTWTILQKGYSHSITANLVGKIETRLVKIYDSAAGDIDVFLLVIIRH